MRYHLKLQRWLSYTSYILIYISNVFHHDKHFFTVVQFLIHQKMKSSSIHVTIVYITNYDIYGSTLLSSDL